MKARKIMQHSDERKNEIKDRLKKTGTVCIKKITRHFNNLNRSLVHIISQLYNYYANLKTLVYSTSYSHLD